ncbi:MAG: AraC family transcriptional regulator ligand-binding domain-containing protein [Kofleriaceae bacterium]
MRTRSGPLFTFRLIPVIGGMLARRGIDVAELLTEAGLPLDAMRGEITAPLRRVQDFIVSCVVRLEAPLFGLELAATLPGGAYGVAEFLVRSAPTVEAGIRVLCEFAALINPSGRFRFVEVETEGRLHYSLGNARDTLGTHLNEFTIAYIVRQISSVLDGRVALAAVWFSHARPDHAAAITQHFDCRVRFGASDCGLAVTRDVLATAPRTADPLLFQFLLDQARAQLTRLGPVDIVTQLVRVLELRLPSGELDGPAVAGALATTPRSLQRYLTEAGTTYRDVLAHVRQRRHAELLGGGVDEAEISRQLGFSDARAMRRSLGRRA